MDDSPNSPITINGTWQVANNSASCSLVGHNNSSKTIVAYRLHLDFTGPTTDEHFPFHHDHFFRPDNMNHLVGMTGTPAMPEPGQDFDLFPIGCDSAMLHPEIKPRAVPLSAHVTVTMVQFNDGSTWGDPKEIAEVMFQRTEAIKYLQSLKDAHVSGGDAGLAQAMQTDPYLNPDRHRRFDAHAQRMMLGQISDPAARRTKIDEKLAAAKAHAAWLK